MKISYIVFFYIISSLCFAYSAFADQKLDTIKNNLLNDSAFINSISEKINKNSIEETIKEFFLKNPEFLLKIQETLFQKQHSALISERENILKKVLPTIYNKEEDLLLGNANAKHTIIEFLDFNCGYCKKSYLAAEDLLKKHSDLKIVLKELPILGEKSVLAHTVSRAFHKIMPNKQALFVHNIMSLSQTATLESAMLIAKDLGADTKLIKNMLANEQTKAKLQEYLLSNVKLAMSLKIQGTPAYIIDGKLFEGAVNLESIVDNLN